jgi:hypothetical protein
MLEGDWLALDELASEALLELESLPPQAARPIVATSARAARPLVRRTVLFIVVPSGGSDF